MKGDCAEIAAKRIYDEFEAGQLPAEDRMAEIFREERRVAPYHTEWIKRAANQIRELTKTMTVSKVIPIPSERQIGGIIRKICGAYDVCTDLHTEASEGKGEVSGG